MNRIRLSLLMAGVSALVLVWVLLTGSAISRAVAFGLDGLALAALVRCCRAGLLANRTDLVWFLLHTPRWLRATAGSLWAWVVLWVVASGGGTGMRSDAESNIIDQGYHRSADFAEVMQTLMPMLSGAGAVLLFVWSALLLAAAHGGEEWRKAQRRPHADSSPW